MRRASLRSEYSGGAFTAASAVSDSFSEAQFFGAKIKARLLLVIPMHGTGGEEPAAGACVVTGSRDDGAEMRCDPEIKNPARNVPAG